MDPQTLQMITELLSAGGPTGLVVFLAIAGWVRRAWKEALKRVSVAETGLTSVKDAITEAAEQAEVTAKALAEQAEATATALTELASASKEQSATLGRVEVTLSRLYQASSPTAYYRGPRRPVPNGRDTGAPYIVVNDDHTPVI